MSSKQERDIQAVVMVELGFRSGMRKGAMKSLLLEIIDFKKGKKQSARQRGQAAIELAAKRAVRVTLAGSMTPSVSRSVNSDVAAL